jgi:pimeloyl-ACP methyl ester carboxylesterase
MEETDLALGDRVLRVRDAGDPNGSVLMYFHLTPGSRLDLCFAEEVAADRGVRLVSFDRPGYGGSTPAPFGLASIARDAGQVADRLGVDRFATFGQSGGGPFALAAGVVLADRVVRVGIASGPGPFQLVPGALDGLDENDRTAAALLPGDPVGAADAFGAGFQGLVSRDRVANHAETLAVFEDLLSPRDREVLHDERFAAALATTMHESLRQGVMGGGWDNVSWIGPWDVDVTKVDCPVLLWYGDEDRFAPPAHGLWLRDHLTNALLIQRAGEGHFGFYEHFGQMLDDLTAPEIPR